MAYNLHFSWLWGPKVYINMIFGLPNCRTLNSIPAVPLYQALGFPTDPTLAFGPPWPFPVFPKPWILQKQTVRFQGGGYGGVWTKLQLAIPQGSNHLLRWWLGCIITSSGRYLGSITFLRRWLDPYGSIFWAIFFWQKWVICIQFVTSPWCQSCIASFFGRRRKVTPTGYGWMKIWSSPLYPDVVRWVKKCFNYHQIQEKSLVDTLIHPIDGEWICFNCVPSNWRRKSSNSI